MRDSIRKILVVDDEPEFRRAVGRHLRREGFSIDSAKDGLDAREKIQESVLIGDPFDLVVTDVEMPGLDGVELLEWIKRERPEISALLISGFYHSGKVQGSIRQELDCCCRKPLTPKEMIGLIGRIEEMRRRSSGGEP